MSLITLAWWTLAVLAAAGLGWLAGGERAAAAAAWLFVVAIAALLARSRRPTDVAVPEGAVRYRLDRAEALVEVWGRSGVRTLVALAIVVGLPGAIALGGELARDGLLDLGLRWRHAVVLALLAPFAAVAAAHAFSAARALRRRERALSWSDDDVTGWLPGLRLVLSRARARSRAWRRLVILSDDSGLAVAVPRDIAARAGVAGQGGPGEP
jgi:hypothetical protein